MLVRTRPLRPAFDRSFDRAFEQLTRSFPATAPRSPVVDAAWQDGSLVLTVDLPGTPAEQVAVTVSGRTLTLSAAAAGASWERSVRLGTTLDPEQVSATYVDGRLTVIVAESAQAEPRRIDVVTTAPAPAETTETAETTEPAADEATAAAQPENGTSDNA